MSSPARPGRCGPVDEAGRAVWAGIACRIETWRDHKNINTTTPGRLRGTEWLLGPRPAGPDVEHWDTTASMTIRHRQLVHAAQHITLDPADGSRDWLDAARQAAALAPPEPPSRGLGRSL